MKLQAASEVIESLKPKGISRNNKGDFSEITDSYLGMGARATIETRIPNRFEFEGWFRFFDKKQVGPRTQVMPALTVETDDEARHIVLRHAISEILVNPHEELAHSEGTLPFNLYVLSARASFLEAIQKIVANHEDEIYEGTLLTLKECLPWMRSVHVCLVSEAVIRSIYSDD
jgi:hypothetical protein